MATYDKHEANEFSKVAAAAGQEFLEVRAKVLTDSAARGFPLVPGESLANLLQAGIKGKQKLTDLHGNIYEKEYERILELSTFDLKLAVETARLAMITLRNALKVYEQDAEHQLREQEIGHELLAEDEETAIAALRVLLAQVRRILKAYGNDIRSQALAQKMLLDEAKIDLNLLIHLTRLSINELAQIALDRNEVFNTGTILQTELNNIRQATTDAQAGTVVTTKKSALQQMSTETSQVVNELIGKL